MNTHTHIYMYVYKGEWVAKKKNSPHEPTLQSSRHQIRDKTSPQKFQGQPSESRKQIEDDLRIIHTHRQPKGDFDQNRQSCKEEQEQEEQEQEGLDVVRFKILKTWWLL